MQVTETLSDGLKRAYTVVLPGADMEGRRAAKLSELGRTLRLPGFRPGKVPLPVVRQRYGSAVMAEVVQESVEAATGRVLSERGLRPAEPPKIAMDAASPAAAAQTGPLADLEFRIEFELLPDIALPDFAAIRLTRPRAEVAEAAVDATVTRFAASQAEWVSVTEDRAAVPGDRLVVDFVGSIDGAAFTGGSGTDTPVELGGAGFIPGFAEQLAGMRPGEQRAIEVTFPADYGVAEVAGRAARFEVTAKALFSRPPVVLDDATATGLGFESLAELRGAVTRRMQADHDKLTRLLVKRALLDALAERATFAAPAGLVEREFTAIWQRLSADLAAGRADAQDSAKDEATLRGEYMAIAERRVRLGLLLSEVGRVHSLVVTQEELTRAMRLEASRYQGQEAQVLEFFRKNREAAESLRGPIFEDKVIDFILELADIEDRVVSIEELQRLAAGEDADPAAAHGEAAPEAARIPPPDAASGADVGARADAGAAAGVGEAGAGAAGAGGTEAAAGAAQSGHDGSGHAGSGHDGSGHAGSDDAGSGYAASGHAASGDAAPA